MRAQDLEVENRLAIDQIRGMRRNKERKHRKTCLTYASFHQNNRNPYTI